MIENIPVLPPNPHSHSVEDLRAFLIEGRARLMQRRPASRMGRDWLQEHCELLDETLRRIYHTAWESVRESNLSAQALHVQAYDGRNVESEAGLALLAIGGYGRGEMCPFSDIDIAFVPAEEEHPVLDAVVKEAFRLIVEVLIDGARLDVGYAYRPIGDCERLDPTAKCALVEARRIAGGPHLLREMREELHATWDSVEFLLDKVRERREIAKRPSLSLYSIEPNLKECVGALREIQTALWATAANLNSDQPLRDLEWRGIVTAADCFEVIVARDYFLRLRTWLHLTAGKKTDVLRIEYQDRAARAFGHNGAGALPAQRLLREYYRHAEAALRFSQKVMRRLIEGPLAIDGHFVARHMHLGVAHPYTMQNHPELVMTPFVLARKYGFSLDSQLDCCLEEALPLMNDATRRHPITRAGFLALMHNVEEAADALTELRARGVLSRVIPEFDDMLHLAPADPSHQLTVGEHCIHAVRQLGDLWNSDSDALRAVWDGVHDVELLTLATLLHDVGKIEIGTDHAVSGEEIAKIIGARLGLSDERNEKLGLLVRRHLLLPRVARLRDLAATGTIREVVEGARDVPTLKMLYLLSLADTQAVGERTYSQLDLETMRELYERVLLAMTREDEGAALTDVEKRESLAQRERERVRREMRHSELDEATLHELSDRLPAAYVLNTPLPVVVSHVHFLHQLPQERAIIDFEPDARGAFTDVTIVAFDDDKPGLLSKICGVVHAVGADILSAQVFTLRDQACPDDAPQNEDEPPLCDVVLDRLEVMANGRALSEARAARLAATLRGVLLGETSIEDILKSAGKPLATTIVPQRVGARNDLSDEHTVISIVTENVPGLLFQTTRALAAVGLDIHTAKIATWAGRAEDAFYVTYRSEDGHNQKIADDSISAVLEEVRQKLHKPEV